MIEEPSADYLFDHFFEADGSSDYLPYTGSLVEVLQERFAFLSAESGPGRTAPTASAGAAGSGSQDLSTRVSSLETTLQSMSQNLEEVLIMMQNKAGKTERASAQRVSLAPQKVVIPPETKPKKKAASEQRFPLLDPSVVAAAISAGVSEDNLTEMQRLIQDGSGKSRKLREPALRPLSKKEVANVLSESEEEEEEPDVGSHVHGGAGGTPMESAVSKPTELVALLSADKVKKSKASKIDLALDNLNASSHADSSSGGGGKRAAAARRALRLAMQESPEEIYQVVERLLLEDLTSQVQAPGMPMASFNARAWVEHRSRIGSTYKTSAYAAWSVAGLLDNLVKGKVSHARAQASLLLLQLDQVAIDKGSWSLAAELAQKTDQEMERSSRSRKQNQSQRLSLRSRRLEHQG